MWQKGTPPGLDGAGDVLGTVLPAVIVGRLNVGRLKLTVGREAADRDGRAAGAPAFGPSILSRVGDTSGLPIVEMFRKAPGEILAAFWATGNPRSRVFRETAVSAPGRLA